jgi:pimeloyl-ACP methyl ester carboxylesterase
MSDTVLFIHGAWLTPLSFEKVRARAESQGFETLAPAWPMDERPVPELRRSPHPELGKLSIGKIVDHYDRIIRGLPRPPILFGHSFGGLFVQLLLDRGLGAAGVAVSPGAPRGVLPALRTVISGLPVFLAWNGWNRALTMSFESFSTNFAQLLTPSEKREAYDRHVVPTPGRIYWQGALGVSTKVDYRNAARAPLLLTNAEHDRIVHPSMVRAAYRKHRRSSVLTAIKDFPGRSHWLLGEPGWEEVADYTLGWAREHARGPLPAARIAS